MGTLFAGFAAWLAQFFTNRGFRIAMAGFFVASVTATLGVLVGIVTTISPQVPDSVRIAMSICAPADWGMQLSTIVGIKATGFVSAVFRQALGLAK